VKRLITTAMRGPLEKPHRNEFICGELIVTLGCFRLA
jgi:hypothetical protein